MTFICVHCGKKAKVVCVCGLCPDCWSEHPKTDDGLTLCSTGKTLDVIGTEGDDGKV